MEPVPFHGASRERPSDGERPTGRRPGAPRLAGGASQSARRASPSPPPRTARPQSGGASLADAPRLNRREVFKQMVVAQLEAGFLRYSRRQALIEYAGRIGISPFDATLLIAEAQFYADRIDPRAVPLDRSHLPSAVGEEPDRSSESLTCRLMFAGAVALLIDLLLVYWLVG